MLTLPASKAPGNSEATDPRVQAEEDAALLRGVASRWLEDSDAVASSSSDSGVALRSVIGRLQEVTRDLEQLSNALQPSKSEGVKTETTELSVPIGILTKNEWLALVRTSVRQIAPYSEMLLNHLWL